MVWDGNIFKSVLLVGASFACCGTAYAVDVVELDRPYVVIGDVVDLPMESTLHAQDILDFPILSLPVGDVVTVSPDDLERRIVRRVPGLKGRLQPQNLSPKHFLYRETADLESAIELTECVIAKVDRDVGQPILRGHVGLSSLCNSDQADVTYDNAGQIYKANSPVTAGQRLPVRSLSVLAVMESGEDMMLESRIGPVEIKRPVTLINPVYRSGLAKVKTSEGNIVVADIRLEGGG